LDNLNTLFVGKVLHSLEDTASTNVYAQNLLSKSKPPEGTVISTQNQTAGRGQIGSSWESEAFKNLTLSIILYPNFILPNQQFLLTQITSLAVHDFIKAHIDTDVFIKWPNDIYIQDRKIAGILIQNSLAGKSISNCIIGIGVNVKQTHFVSNAPNPTSLTLETKNDFDLNELQLQLLKCVELRYLQLKRGELAQIAQDYHRYLFRNQKLALYQYPNGEQFIGKIIGVNTIGKLQIESSKGVEEFGMKEVRFLL